MSGGGGAGARGQGGRTRRKIRSDGSRVECLAGGKAALALATLTSFRLIRRVSREPARERGEGGGGSEEGRERRRRRREDRGRGRETGDGWGGENR